MNLNPDLELYRLHTHTDKHTHTLFSVLVLHGQHVEHACVCVYMFVCVCVSVFCSPVHRETCRKKKKSSSEVSPNFSLLL